MQSEPEALTNLALGGDAHANHALSMLRASVPEGILAHHVPLAPGIALHAAPGLGLSGRYASPRGIILELDAAMTGARGGWFALHIALPAYALADHGVFGFAARLRAPQVCSIRACLRSGTEDGFVDAFFEKHLIARPDETSHLDALALALREDVPAHAPWREVILFLPIGTVRLCLIDLRMFLV
ncbi:hypothetical protein SAMN05421666_3367 [Roseovarius nanhaiticus]|uniref:Uncharacterized protein n=1 Tax=Roseovarius nanhaiticus TaxID=573024 RepID=A0A1N7HLW2_9RHOB|nr:hypothetical protein [Roseovarius nanhaiticus]SEL28522.1 hypothetical protein SAMN05216208_3343 [Roseovarius nanhaiticus]SIS25751.1 hypothetical protein SAMN05421666_3367 [Roseovarius nanhaiticus]